MDLNFTIVFKPQSGVQTTYELKYAPIPTWQHNGVVVQNMKDHGDGLHYGEGAVDLLLDYHRRNVGPVKDLGVVCVLVHDVNYALNDGFDDESVLDRIKADLESAGFGVTAVSL